MMPIWEKQKNIYLMKRGGFMTPAVVWSVAALFVYAFRLASLKKFVICAALFALGFVDALLAWMSSGPLVSSWVRVFCFGGVFVLLWLFCSFGIVLG